MKKAFFIISMVMGILPAHADDYPFLTFETADGTKTSVSTASLSITIQDGKLMAGSAVFTAADLSKMYFSTSDESIATDIADAESLVIDNSSEIYDLQGRKVSKEQMRHGVYLIKAKSGMRKVMNDK